MPRAGGTSMGRKEKHKPNTSQEWFSDKNLCIFFGSFKDIPNIYADGELDKDRTYKKFLLVRQEGKRQVRRNIDHYNLDVIIALGYKGAVGEQWQSKGRLMNM